MEVVFLEKNIASTNFLFFFAFTKIICIQCDKLRGNVEYFSDILRIVFHHATEKEIFKRSRILKISPKVSSRTRCHFIKCVNALQDRFPSLGAKRVEKIVVGEREKGKGNRIVPFTVKERHKL